MTEKLIELLETFGYKVFLQGSAPEVVPDSFFTFWDFSSSDASAYDNDSRVEEKGYWVYSYSIDPVECEEMINKAKKLLKENDFIPEGSGISVMAHNKDYTGKMLTVYILNKY